MALTGRDESLAAINRTVARLLRLNANRGAFARSASAAGLALTQPAYLLLRAVIDGGPLPMGELAAQVHMDPGTAARQVAKLVDGGFVRRRPDPSDGRVSLIGATAKGRTAGQKLLGVRLRHLTESVSGWSERDLAQFAELLDRFVNDMTATSYRRVSD